MNANILDFETGKKHIGYVLRFHYENGRGELEALFKVTKCYGEDALDLRTCRLWYQKFRQGIMKYIMGTKAGRILVKHCLLYHYHKRNNIDLAYMKIIKAFGNRAITYNICCRLYEKFRAVTITGEGRRLFVDPAILDEDDIEEAGPSGQAQAQADSDDSDD